MPQRGAGAPLSALLELRRSATNRELCWYSPCANRARCLLASPAWAMTILAANAPHAPPLPPLTPARGVSLNLAVGMPTPLQRANVRATAAPLARASLAKLRLQPAASASPRKPHEAAARPEGVPSNYATLLRIEHAMATPRGASTAPRLPTPMGEPSSTPGLGRRVRLQQELEQSARAGFAQQAEDLRSAIAAVVEAEWKRSKAWAEGAARRVRATSRGAVAQLQPEPEAEVEAEPQIQTQPQPQP